MEFGRKLVWKQRHPLELKHQSFNGNEREKERGRFHGLPRNLDESRREPPETGVSRCPGRLRFWFESTTSRVISPGLADGPMGHETFNCSNEASVLSTLHPEELDSVALSFYSLDPFLCSIPSFNMQFNLH